MTLTYINPNDSEYKCDLTVQPVVVSDRLQLMETLHQMRYV